MWIWSQVLGAAAGLTYVFFIQQMNRLKSRFGGFANSCSEQLQLFWL